MVADAQLEALRNIGGTLPLDLRRELCDCVLLGRLIRIAVPLRDIGRLPDVTSRLNISYHVGRESFQLRTDPGMRHWSSTATACSDAQRHAIRFVYLHEQGEVCRVAEATDAANDDRTLGHLLGYPPCCVDAFDEWSENGVGIDPIGATLHMSGPGDRVMVYDGPSPFSRYFSGGLISHFPCSLTCARTRALAAASLNSFRTAFPSLEASLMELEACFTLFQAHRGVGAWRRFKYVDDRVIVDPISFLGSGRLVNQVRDITEIRVDSLHIRLLVAHAVVGTLAREGGFVGSSSWKGL